MEATKLAVLERIHGLGTRNVLCLADGKAPADGRGSKESPRRALADLTEALDSGLNHGIATGTLSDGRILFVLDSDFKANGETCVKCLEDLYGQLPETFTVDTPSGGKHRYFYSSVLFTSSSGLFKDLFDGASVDVKCQTGYVVAPPSQIKGHPYSIAEDLPIAELPPAWIECFKPVLAIVGADGRPDASSVVQKEAFASMPIVEGFKGDVAYYISKFNKANPHRALLESFGYKQTSPMRYTHPYGSTSVDNVSLFPADKTRMPYLGADFISFHRGANDLVPSSENQPRDSFDVFVHCKHGGDKLAALNEIKGDVDAKLEIDQLPEEPIPSAFAVTDWRVRFDQDPEMQGGEMIVEDILNLGELVMFFGAQASCKTFMVLDLAFSLATGIPFLNQFMVSPKRRYKSALVLTEVGGGKAQNRIDAWVKRRAEQNGVTEASLHALIRENIAYTDRACTCGVAGQNVEAFEAAIKERNPDFVADIFVFDTLSQCYRGDENDNSQMATYLAHVRNEVCSRGKTAIIIHHPPKNNNNIARGASSLMNNLQLIYNINVSEKDENVIWISRVKANDDTMNKPFAVRKNIIDLGINKHHIREGVMKRSVVLDFDEKTVCDMDNDENSTRHDKIVSILSDHDGPMTCADITTKFNEMYKVGSTKACSVANIRIALNDLVKRRQVVKDSDNGTLVYEIFEEIAPKELDSPK